MRQERQKLQPDGSLLDYLKPRITTDSSDGGDAGSPNEGCDRAETEVRFPTVRHLGEAAAICQQAGEDDSLDAHFYVFDLSSAYRYLPLQRTDWWMHCFWWMRADGSWGVAIDTRLAFGGSYSPQRFERVATFAISLADERVAAFDAAHPYPPGVQAWAARRGMEQEAGLLPLGARQSSPRHIHAYIDDAGGTALCDQVEPPPTSHLPPTSAISAWPLTIPRPGRL